MGKVKSVATGVPKSQETVDSNVNMAGSEVDSDNIDDQASSDEDSSEESESSSEEDESDGEDQNRSGGASVPLSSKKKDGKWP